MRRLKTVIFHKKVRKPSIIKIKTKDGLVKFKGRKLVKVPVKVKFKIK